MSSIDLINVLSYLIGVENLSKNDEQIKQLDSHLCKQDKQYMRIINLLEKLIEEVKNGEYNRKN